MDELLAKHRKEQRDLQSKITQKKKSATKKTRKGVNDDCAELERQLRERQLGEIAALNNDCTPSITDELDCETLKFEETNDKPNGHLNNENPPNPEGRLSRVGASDLSHGLEDLSIRDGTEHSRQPKKPNRQKARLAKRAADQEALATRAAEEAADLPDLREAERAAMLKEFEKHGLREREIRPDGHCLYSAVADQLKEIGVGLKPQLMVQTMEGDDYRVVRHTAAEFISQNPDDFVPFLEEPLDEYTHKIRDTAEWGGQLELLALAKAYGVEINVVQGISRIEKIVPEMSTEGRTIWLAYYRHNFGLGEHYNSLRKVP